MVQEFAKGSGGWVLKKLAKLCCSAVALAAVAAAVTKFSTNCSTVIVVQ